ncbi:LysR family transcriptional regulator [Photobacterium indicum]|uniref:LysR family transcriptional regulator n=1 Tax=Photobacterium indicum TaxID=81447 RepID=UPI003D0DF5A5
MNKINWDDLKFFITLYESNTVSVAANRLNVNYATVSRRIDRLEDALKLKLFDRTKDGFVSTIEGTLLYESSVGIREKITNLKEELSPNSRFNQNVKISMVPFLAEYFVIENLHNLHRRFPELRLDIESSSRNVNLSKLEADIALRMELPEKGESICKKLGAIDYVIYGNKYWLNKLANNESVNIITYTTAFSHLQECKYLIKKFSTKAIRVQTDSVSAQKKAASSGYGIALIPRIVLDVTETNFVQPTEEVKRDVWMLTSKKTASHTPKILIMEELAKIFSQELAIRQSALATP